ncbi:Eco57I restriction-modification methylase domain-containing protein [Natranaeroarchaeum aerophilus]|uniref:site-specific DNA-methyltransferase (adenine-specific) n=1 Tax=Natranaeroarchaeum aerophilus TaxID=2917711 RepID=A0AAE3FSB0_9EURY|nr:DNA methyltransferase [Natranaeroarchaeum aerophilus]MCL9814404.1 hypothetical protein [Natranaeroarchaeum aerophilus]
MTLQQISASDITSWDSLQDIAATFEKRGLKLRPNLGEDHQLVLQLSDEEFVVLVEAGPGESATDFKPENRTRHTNLVATNDFEDFTFLTRVRSWEGQQHGRIKHQKLSFSKKQFQSGSGEKNTILQKLNSIEYGSSAAIYDTLYDTRKVVKEFYQQFESLRTNLVQEVSGIPDNRGDAKQRYVQIILDRMIFLYFIQEKRLLDRNPDYLHEEPAKVVDEGDDRYEEFYEPLFFDYLAEDKQNPDFGKLPYLNGGLFAKNPVEEEFEDAKLGNTAEKTNELFDDILDFLSDWNWNVDERLDIVDPKNLSPAILGHIFEQTVNQKEMGAYYTPEEITGFMARRTIHPYLLDELNEVVGATYEEIDDVFGFPETGASADTAAIADGGMVTQQAATENVETGHVETLYHDILKEAQILDPAVGSGAFLLAGQEILLDLYMQCIEFFQQLEAEGKGWELESRTRDELETIASGGGNASLFAKRTIILNNLYGVDIDEGAVEICKLRLWLSMVADIEDEPGEVEPLPNIDFNIRQGNSLIGFTDVQEIATDKGDASLSNFGGGVGESVQEMYEEVITAVKRHKNADTSQEATNARRLAETRIDEYSDSLDEKILQRFEDAGVDDVSLTEIREHSPFHWVLEFASVYADGGFDVIVGNPPWDKVKVTRDDYFIKYDPGFRSLPTKLKDDRQEELLEKDEIAEGWEEYKHQADRLGTYYRSQFSKQTAQVSGRTVAGDTDLAPLFLERSEEIVDDGSYVSLIVPNIVFTGGSYKNLRRNLLKKNTLDSLFTFENRGIFQHVDTRYTFTISTFTVGSKTQSLLCSFKRGDLSVLRTPEASGISTPAKVLLKFSPESGMFPKIRSSEHVDILQKITQHSSLEQAWTVNTYRELDQTNDSDRFFNEDGENRYRLYGGRNIFQFSYSPPYAQEVDYYGIPEDEAPEKSAKTRIRQKNTRALKNAIYEHIDAPSSKSKKKAVNEYLDGIRGEGLSESDVLLDCTEYRLAYRDIARPTDERTTIAAVLPKGVATYTNLTTIRPYSIEPDKASMSEVPLHGVYKKKYSNWELFALLGLLNSLPFDFLIGEKTDKRIATYSILESQVPKLDHGGEWFEYIAYRAARLNCYGDEFREMRERLGDIEPATDKKERSRIQAEIDAAALHVYGLDYDDAKFILEDFHRVQNPRVMTDAYFETVEEKYLELSDQHSIQ